MKKFYVSVSVLVLALSVGACQGAWKSLGGSLPVPPAVSAPQLDPPAYIMDAEGQRVKPDLPPGFPWITARGEETINPHVGMSRKAWEAILLGYEALRQSYCEGKATIEIANGQEPERIPLCPSAGP